MALLDQLMVLPDRQVTRTKREVSPWVKITPSNNPQKPQVKLSSKPFKLTSSSFYNLIRKLNLQITRGQTRHFLHQHG